MPTTPQHLAHVVASAFDELLRQTEALAHAHDRLALPEHADAFHDWAAILVRIDAMGEAAYRVAELANDGLIPSLKALKVTGQAALTEIASLDAMLDRESPTSPVTRPTVVAPVELFSPDELQPTRATRRTRRRHAPPSTEARRA